MARSLALAGAVAMAGRGQVITPEAELESGCGCRVLGDRGSSGRTTGALALLGILAAALGRRRRINLPRWL
jgi:MYXO-CTERM domain-containing protein